MNFNIDEMSSLKLNQARTELAHFLKIIKDIITGEYTHDYESNLPHAPSSIGNIDDNDNYNEQLVINYMKSFNIDHKTNLTNKDKMIISLLNERIKSGVFIIKAKIELDGNLVNLDYDDFMKKITYKDVEDKIVNDIRSWCVPLSTLFETYIIPETKVVQYKYARSLRENL